MIAMSAKLFAAWAGGHTPEVGVTAVTSVTASTTGVGTEGSAAAAPLPAPADVGIAVAAATEPPSPPATVTAVAVPVPAWLPENHQINQYGSRRNLGSPKIEIGIDADAPTAWQALFEQRVECRQRYNGRTKAEAKILAFGDILVQWHQRHGVQQHTNRCAGCREVLVGDDDPLDLGHDARVHLDARLSCLTRYGQAWRTRALGGLLALGLNPPPGFELL